MNLPLMLPIIEAPNAIPLTAPEVSKPGEIATAFGLSGLLMASAIFVFAILFTLPLMMGWFKKFQRAPRIAPHAS